jgi:hypothetical protein
MQNNPIQYDNKILDNAVTGIEYLKYCNKNYKTTLGPYNDLIKLDNNDVWFVKTDFIFEFFSKIQNEKRKISIVLHDSDDLITDKIVLNKPNCVVKIFGPHNISLNNNSIPIPVGLGPPPPYGHGAPLSKDIKLVNTFNERSELLYVNFRPYTYPSERIPLLEKFKSLPFSGITYRNPCEDRQTFDVYLNDLINHKFCLCPRGNGIESHRMWECLYARTIPIVKYEPAHRNWKELPILFVNDWNEITKDFLNDKYEEMSNIKYDYSKLDASWWGKQFRNFNE